MEAPLHKPHRSSLRFVKRPERLATLSPASTPLLLAGSSQRAGTRIYPPAGLFGKSPAKNAAAEPQISDGSLQALDVLSAKSSPSRRDVSSPT
jgi:hypothetical protein